MTDKIKLDNKFDATAGEVYRAWRLDLLNAAANVLDASGSSLADFFLGIDMGGPEEDAIPMPEEEEREVRFRLFALHMTSSMLPKIGFFLS